MDYVDGYQEGISQGRCDCKNFIPKRNEIPEKYRGKSPEFLMGFRNGYETGYEKAVQVAKDFARINGHI